MELVIQKNALAALSKVRPKAARAIRNRLKSIAVDPFAKHTNVERLKGVKDGFRLRHGSLRVLYRLDRNAGRMIVEVVATRGEAYRIR